MSLCVGWEAETECPYHRTTMHGCKHPDGHVGEHECTCGATTTRDDILQWGGIGRTQPRPEPAAPAPSLCPICAYPMKFSDDRTRLWCSVYGDHSEQDSVA